MKKALVAFAFVIILATRAAAATKYWDIDGTTAGAGGATPSGNWNTTTSNWTTDSTGSSAATTWASGDAAIFSAGTDATGTFTVTTTAATTASSITVDEGLVQHAGTSTNSLTTSALTINSGATFSVSTSSSFLAPAGSVLTLNGGTIQNRNGGVGSSFLTLSSTNSNMKITLGSGGGHVSVTGASTAISIYTGLIDGTGPLTIDGTNNATFRLTTTPATYSGATTITNGAKLQISTTANVLPAGTDMTINSGGIFDFQNAQTINSLAGAGTLTSGASGFTLTIAGNNSTNFSGIWSGAGRINVNKSGGTFTLSGVNTATGRFTNTAGTTTVASGASLGGAAVDVVVDGGTLNFNNTGTQSIENFGGAGGTVNLTSGLTLATNAITGSSSSKSYAGVIAGAGGFSTASTATDVEILSGANAYSGTTTISGAGIRYAAKAAMPLLAATDNVKVQSGGTLAVNAGGGATEWSAGTSGEGTIGGLISGAGGQTGTSLTQVGWASGSTLGIDTTNGSLAYAGNVGGFRPQGGGAAIDSVGLNKLGTNTLTLNNANTYTGGTKVTAGTLAIGNDSALGTGTLTLAGGGIAASGGPRTIANNATMSVSSSVGGTDNLTINGNFTNAVTAGLLTSTNVGSTTLNGSVFLSDSAATARTLSLVGTGTSNPVFVVSGNVANFNGAGLAGNMTIGGGASTSGATVTLSGANTHSGNTTLNTASTLNLNSAGALGTSTLVIGGNGSLDNKSGNPITFSNNINLSGGSPTFVGTNDISFGNNTVAISAANRTITTNAGTLTIGSITQDVAGRNFTKAGNGTLVVSGASSYTGVTTISGGTMSISSLTNGGANSGVGAATNAAANLVLNGGTLKYTGAIAATDRNFTLGASGGALDASGSQTVAFNSTGTMATSGTATTARTLTLTGSNIGSNSISIAIADPASATTSVVKSGIGKWVLSGANTYTGTTRSGSGTLGVGNTLALQKSTLDMNSADSGDVSFEPAVTAATLGGLTGSRNLLLESTTSNSVAASVGNNDTSTTYDGQLSGSGSLTKVGAGTLTLTAGNTYGGGTTINAGTLKTNNTTGSATGAGAIVVSSGGTLAGTGAVAGAVSINNGGTLAPGASIESLDTGGLSFVAGSTFSFEMNSDLSPAVGADLVNANGALSIAVGAILSIADAGMTVLPGTTKFTLISYSGIWDGGVFDTFADDSIVTIGANQYVVNYNDSVAGSNFGGGSYGSYVTLTAVPEASTLIFGLLVCVVVGLIQGGRKWMMAREV